MLEKSQPHRVKGTAVFLTSDPDIAPAALLHNLKHNKVLHEQNVVLTSGPRTLRASAMTSGSGSSTVGRLSGGSTLTYGYMETPNIPRGLALLRKQGFKFDIMATSFFVSRRSIRPVAASAACRSGRTSCSSASPSPPADATRLLPDPDRARGRGRHAGDGLMAPPLVEPLWCNSWAG